MNARVILTNRPLVPLTLEDVMQEHVCKMGNIIQLVAQLTMTLELVKAKCEPLDKVELLPAEVVDGFLSAANAETSNLIDQLSWAHQLAMTAILPITDFKECGELATMMMAIRSSIEINLHIGALPSFETFRNLISQAMVMLTELPFIHTDIMDGEILIFHDLVARYKKENAEAIRLYLDDISSTFEAKAQLRKDFDQYTAVQIWNKNAHDVTRTLRDLRSSKAHELDLLPLVEYIAKYEALLDHRKVIQKSRVTIVKGDYIEKQIIENQNNSHSDIMPWGMPD